MLRIIKNYLILDLIVIFLLNQTRIKMKKIVSFLIVLMFFLVVQCLLKSGDDASVKENIDTVSWIKK